MAAKLSPLFNDQTLTAANTFASGYKLFTYAAGSSTKQSTFTDSAGTVPQSNPIILNASGQPTNGPIWLAAGSAYKFVLALPADTDPPTSPVKTFDNIIGVGDTGAISVSQWQPSGVTPTYVSTTSFTVPGDQTIEFHVGRRVQFTTTGGTVYGIIATTAFTALTTVGMTMDSGQLLDSGLSVVNLSLLRNDRPALPASAARSGANTDITSLVLTGLLTANGQIKFPATQNPSSDANTLDDYKEGSWGPVITFGGASVGITYVTKNASYTKIGNMVTVDFSIALSSKGSSVGGMLITGLPFNIRNFVTFTYASPAPILFSGMATTWVSMHVAGNLGAASLQVFGATGTAATHNQTIVMNTDCANGAVFQGSYTYLV